MASLTEALAIHISRNFDHGFEAGKGEFLESEVNWFDFVDADFWFTGDIDDDNTVYWLHDWRIRVKTSDDTRAPDQVGIAPAATTDYKAGDTVRFSVIYDELIKEATDVQIDVNNEQIQQYMPVENVQFIGGVGTNILVFEGTATRDFSNTTWPGSGTNKELLEVTPVNGGHVKDVIGNG